MVSATWARSPLPFATCLVVASLTCLAIGCSRTEQAKKVEDKPAPSDTVASIPVTFVDVTEQAGIRFRHNSGAFGRKYLPETMGSGAAFLDVDNDGWQDILLVNSQNWPGRP